MHVCKLEPSMFSSLWMKLGPTNQTVAEFSTLAKTVHIHQPKSRPGTRIDPPSKWSRMGAWITIGTKNGDLSSVSAGWGSCMWGPRGTPRQCYGLGRKRVERWRDHLQLGGNKSVKQTSGFAAQGRRVRDWSRNPRSAHVCFEVRQKATITITLRWRWF